jgi:hypothetical protein
LKPDNLGITFAVPNSSTTATATPPEHTSLVLKIFDFDIARLVPKEPKSTTTTTDPSLSSTVISSTSRSLDAKSTNSSGGDVVSVSSASTGTNGMTTRATSSSSSSDDDSLPSSSSSSSSSSLLFKMTGKMGSPRYMAPETARSEQYNLRSEVYTVCLLIHEVLLLQKPYDELPPEKHGELVHFDINPGYRPEIRSCWNWPIELEELFHRGWSADIQQRPSMKELHTKLKRTLPKLLLSSSPSPQEKQLLQQNSKQQPPTLKNKKNKNSIRHHYQQQKDDPPSMLTLTESSSSSEGGVPYYTTTPVATHLIMTDE